MSSSWLDPEGSVTSGVPLGGWLSCGGGLCGKLFGGSGIILVVIRRRVCGFPLVWCHRGLVYKLGTRWAPLLGPWLPYDPIKMHTRR